MLNISELTPADQLRKLAVFLEADFSESLGASKLVLDNDNGKGVITNHVIFSGLVVRTYNIKLSEEFIFTKDESQMNPLYFLYCIEGYFYHKFENTDKVNKIGHLQNVILSSATDEQNTIILPANVQISMTAILAMKENMTEDVYHSREGLWKDVFELFEVDGQDTAFQYFGEISPRIAEHTTLLVKNTRTDVIGRLLAESAVLKTISEQIDSYQKSDANTNTTHGLRDDELRKIIDLGDYIKSNIGSKLSVKELSRTAAMGPAKLQSGVQHIFGETVNSLIIRLKMERARELLLNTNNTISEIVYSIGLSSRSYFSKKYKEVYGLLPSDFRKKVCDKEVIFELSYRSKAKKSLTQSDIDKMVSNSRSNNMRHNISGCLVHHEATFFQMIEGSKKDVLELYNSIKSDDRHTNVEIIWKGFTVGRTFEGWHLATVSGGGDLRSQDDPQLFEHINVNEMLDSLKNTSVAADILWKRVSDRMKVAG
ncbi:BLUF domain-containing protein [Dokdonia sp. Hel_I_53]|uniref:BLUF domain-containing protein n=1 Tax=Dokdonia sp. Hel_I_53 TaxID=1566287 RepID=UPI001199F984|nr:BLUF domain-containing protein [Dokdonia sp. Hel_I_53]TVZ52132.1 AraC-like DNA-binding protein [Dokdonia sp. Hel_I_53]